MTYSGGPVRQDCMEYKNLIFAFRILSPFPMNPNTEYELFTQSVYQQLLNYQHVGITKVKHNKKLKGRSGCNHQIDVYWEYEKDGNIHRKAIECKNYNRRVSKDKVCAFQGVLADLGDIEGIMVSKEGFQKGAKEYAKEYGISLKELRPPKNGETIIGTIDIHTHAEVRHTRFKVDEEWAKINKFNVQGYREFYAMLDYTNAENWKSATHIPLETVDHTIIDSKGNSIITLEELEQKIANCSTTDYPFVFEYDDAYIKCRHFGPVKILEVKYEYEIDDQKTIINMDAEGFVKAILRDALSDNTDFVVMR